MVAFAALVAALLATDPKASTATRPAGILLENLRAAPLPGAPPPR